jgi:exportin-2 (importin alpha re-exporter)
MFRSKLSKPLLVDTFPRIVNLVASDSNVVHSYAAIAAERLLALHINGEPLLTQQDVSQHLQQLMKLIFESLGKVDSTENEYLVKCVMRVINFVGPQIVPIADQCLDWCVPACFLAFKCRLC